MNILPHWSRKQPRHKHRPLQFFDITPYCWPGIVCLGPQRFTAIAHIEHKPVTWGES